MLTGPGGCGGEEGSMWRTKNRHWLPQSLGKLSLLLTLIELQESGTKGDLRDHSVTHFHLTDEETKNPERLGATLWHELRHSRTFSESNCQITGKDGPRVRHRLKWWWWRECNYTENKLLLREVKKFSKITPFQHSGAWIPSVFTVVLNWRNHLSIKQTWGIKNYSFWD